MPPPERRGFSLAEVLLAAGLSTLVLVALVLLARHFLFSLMWSGETFAGIHEMALLESTLRRDLARTGLTESPAQLAVELGPGRLKLTLPAGSTPAWIEYRHDLATRMLVRAPAGGPAQPLGQGMVRAFEVSSVFTRARAPRGQELVGSLPAGEVPQSAGLRVRLALEGQKVGGTAARQSFELATHVFPLFANQRLSSIWRKAAIEK